MAVALNPVMANKYKISSIIAGTVFPMVDFVTSAAGQINL